VLVVLVVPWILYSVSRRELVAVEEELSEKTKAVRKSRLGGGRYLVNTEMKTPAQRPLLSLYQAN
jgi:hypothetical protein